MKKNVYSMTDADLLEFIVEELNNFRTENQPKSSIATGYQKTKLSELQQYSNLLQRPVACGITGASELKAEIDSIVGQYTNTTMIREIKPLDMSNYWKSTNQFTPFIR